MGTTLRRLRERPHADPQHRALPSGAADRRGVARSACASAIGATSRARFPMLAAVDFEYTWGGVMGATFNGAQFFGELAPNLYAAAGYNGVGIAMGTISGALLADLALGADSALLADMARAAEARLDSTRARARRRRPRDAGVPGAQEPGE